MTNLDQIHADHPFLYNAWYAVGWYDDVTTSPLSRRVLDVALVIFRTESGKLSVLEDRCPHRSLPLSCGKVQGEAIECRYHGLRFDPQGVCVSNPHGPVPRAARAQSFPVVERHRLVWVWMGQPEAAELAAIPDLSFIDDESLHAGNIRGYMHTDAAYTLMADNILDLGHIEFLHPLTLGSDAVRKASIAVNEESHRVIVERRMEAELLPEFMAQEYGCVGQRVERGLTVGWEAPANLVITIEVTPDGAAPKRNQSCHLMTPETRNSTHYFWANTRIGPPDAALDRIKRDGLARVFAEEDKPVVEAQQRNLDQSRARKRPPVLLTVDAGLNRARRRLAELINRESANSQ